MKTLLIISVAALCIAYSYAGYLLLVWPDFLFTGDIQSNSYFFTTLLPSSLSILCGIVNLLAAIFLIQNKTYFLRWSIAGGIFASFFSLVAVVTFSPVYLVEWFCLAAGILNLLISFHYKDDLLNTFTR